MNARSSSLGYVARQWRRSALASCLSAFTFALATLASAQSPTSWRVGALHFHGCRELDASQVRPLLDAEVRPDAASSAAAVDVDVTCAGDTALLLSLTGRGGAPRVVDVEDIPMHLRARLAALAIAELLFVSSAREGRSEMPDGIPAASLASPDTTSATRRSEHDAAATTERLAVDAAPTTERLAVDAVPTTKRTVVPRRARRALLRNAASARLRAPLLAAALRASMRAFLTGRTLLWGGDLVVRVGPVGIGAHLSTAVPVRDALGTLTPSLVLALVELAVVGIDFRAVDIRVFARGSAGRAAIDAVANQRGARAYSPAAPFFEFALVLSAALVVGILAVDIDLAFGYSSGLVALAGSRDALALDGATACLAVGVEMLP